MVMLQFKLKKKILKYSLSTYSQYHTNANYSDYISNFGNPNEYADTLLEDSGLDNLSQSLRSKNKMIIIFCIGVIIIVFSIYVYTHIMHRAAVSDYTEIVINSYSTTESTVSASDETYNDSN